MEALGNEMDLPNCTVVAVRPGTRLRALIALAVIGALSAGCVNTTIIKANPVSTIKMAEDIPDSELLDVGIRIFDPGLPEDSADWEEDFIFPEVRKAEARYMPYVLKDTMQGTGHWGAVRVVPTESNSVDLMIEGQIVSSDGERLRVAVTATDSTGDVWLEKTYDDLAAQLSYREGDADYDPFQDVYNTIANDLALALETREGQELERIRQVSELRFARELSPEVFDSYLDEADDGRYTVRRLPAYGDPMITRMQRIREREYMLFDTLDGHFEGFYEEMTGPYDEWRRYNYEEVIALRELKRQARMHKIIGAAAIAGGLLIESDSSTGRAAQNSALYGGLMAFKTGMDMNSQSSIHAEALRELGNSFEAEVTPAVMEIEGRTLTLNGSVDVQFEEWRRMLREIYALETGLTVDAAPIDGTVDTAAIEAAESEANEF